MNSVPTIVLLIAAGYVLIGLGFFINNWRQQGPCVTIRFMPEDILMYASINIFCWPIITVYMIKYRSKNNDTQS